MTDFAQMSLADLVGYCRGLRLEAEAYGETHGVATDSEPSVRDHGRPVRGVAGVPSLTIEESHHSPFWQSLASDRDAKIIEEAGPNPGAGYVLRADGNGRYGYEDTHAAHRKLPVAKRIRECRECGEKAIRRMCALSELDHRGRNGRRLAEIFGVRL